MIQSTVGRVVWYWDVSGTIPEQTQPHAALIAHVWTDRMVNLVVFDANGVPYSRTSVTLVQDGDEKPQGRFCEWMPYQKGQAAKTEQLEKLFT